MTSLESAFQAIDLYAEHRIRAVNMPGLALAVTDREKLLRLATFGYADLAAAKPIQPGTMFEIGSIGKSFTNVALLQLRDEGRLDLHAPVSTYLPWFEVPSDYGPITTHHLMTHTAGLPSGTDIGPHGLYEAWALRELRTGTPPGEYFRYSNVGYKTLGFLLGELDGRSYSESIQTRVLEPLGMRDSHPVIGYETRKRAAVGYRSFYDDRPEHIDHGLAPALWTEYGVGRRLPGIHRRGYDHLLKDAHERRLRAVRAAHVRGQFRPDDPPGSSHPTMGRRPLRLRAHAG